MIHGTIEKEIRFVLQTLESVESCKNLQGNANHDVLCYVPSLIEIAQNYAVMLSETPPILPILGKLEKSLENSVSKMELDTCRSLNEALRQRDDRMRKAMRDNGFVWIEDEFKEAEKESK